MPLYFRPRRQRPMGRRAQYALAFIVLALALCVVGVWLVVSYYTDQSQTPTDSDDTSSPPAVTYTADDTTNLLVIIQDEGVCHFALVQADPADGRIRTVPIPTTLKAGENTALSDLLNKSGAAKATQQVAQLLELPVSHYMQFTIGKTESFLNYLGEGVPFTLSQTVKYTDENGATQSLKKGDHTLSATGAASLLRYTGWKDKAYTGQVTADLLDALFDHYLLPSRHYGSDFATLANLCQTDVRISDFSAWKDTLEYLATLNSDSGEGICHRVDLAGDTDEQGLFVPDVRQCRKTTPLYE